MLEQKYYVKPNPPQWDSPEDMSFTISVRGNKGKKGASTFQQLYFSLFLIPDIMSGDIAIQLDDLDTLGLIGTRKQQEPSGSTDSSKVRRSIQTAQTKQY